MMNDNYSNNIHHSVIDVTFVYRNVTTAASLFVTLLLEINQIR